MADDVTELLLDTGDFAESVTHLPFGGVAENVAAIVNEAQPAQPSDARGGARQIFTAWLLMSSEAAARVVVGAGTEVSRFQFHGHTWRAIASATGHGSLTVKVERHSTQSTRAGWQQGVP